jgi:hypothetical protein
LDLCLAAEPALERLRDDAELLTPFAVAPRYVVRPIKDEDLARRGLDAARRVRDAVMPLLNS